MRRIYKYTLETTDVQKVKIPKLVGAKSFKEQVLNLVNGHNKNLFY